MLKRITTTFMAIILCLIVTIPVSANSQQYDQTLPIYPNMQAAFDAMGDLELSAEGTMIDQNSRIKSASTLGCFVVRNGRTEDCEVYLKWAGDTIYSSWRFTKGTVDNGSLIGAKKFATLSQTVRDVVGATVGTVRIANIKIPTSEEYARVNLTNLQGYRMIYGDWLSALIVGKAAKIN